MRIFGPIKDEITGSWRKLHNEVLHNLYSPLLLERSEKGSEMGMACSTHRREAK
jgi:hypothetical protein